jgi:hypothetical protein
MTKLQYLRKCKELKKGVNVLIDKEILKLLNSGAFDLKDYQNDFLLPKAVITAIAEEIKHQFRPLNDDGKKLVKNLEYFT